jgi:hypothetical protein
MQPRALGSIGLIVIASWPGHTGFLLLSMARWQCGLSFSGFDWAIRVGLVPFAVVVLGAGVLSGALSGAFLAARPTGGLSHEEQEDAFTILKNDHETVTKLFKQFKSVSKANNTAKKSGIVEKITAALEAHAAVEEEIFYPVVKKARAEKTKDEVREAYEEHKQIKALLAALSETYPDDESFDAKG